jgi:hypothetical protein
MRIGANTRNVPPYRRPKGHPAHADSYTLIAAVLKKSPSLPGAACTAQPGMFDGDLDDDHTPAIEVCRTCPALRPCEAWVTSVPKGFVTGVVAGSYRPAPHTKRRHQKGTP